MIPAKTSRRTSRSRVFVAGDSSPRATSSPTLRAALRDQPGPRSARSRSRPRCATPALIQSLRGRLRLCRTGHPAWRLRLPPRARAQSRPCATPRRSGPPCGSACPPAWRCSSWRSSPRSRSVLRAAGSRGRTRTSSTRRALTHAIADPVLAPLARWDSVWYLTIADSGYGDSTARAAFFPLYPLLVRASARRSAARTRRCWSRRSWCRWRAFLARADAAVPAHRARAGPPARAARRCCCSRCSRPRSTSARRTRRACSCCWPWARSTRRGPAAGRGRARAPGSPRPPAAPGCSC